MSLVSAGTLMSGTREYLYRGVQQLPIVLSATSLLFSITTGSIAHVNLTVGLVALMPIYTFIMQKVLGGIFTKVAPAGRLGWTKSTSDVCRLIPPEGPKLTFYRPDEGNAEAVPSYWLMSVVFFIGYCISNAVDIFSSPAENDADPNNKERRTYQAVFLITSICLLSALVLGARFYYMSGCEGRGVLGYTGSLIAAVGAASIGYGMYDFSRKCGARTSDLFGVLSQILPNSATASNPVVCTSD
jgi:TRAP-type mannitol/chloroaromatic compound transport system permease large subunit